MPKSQVSLTFEVVSADTPLAPDIALGTMCRARVPGGWLVNHVKSGSLAFVPDPDGEWGKSEASK